MTIAGGGSRLTGMTAEQANAVLEGDPTQEELFAALVTLAKTSPGQYDQALTRAAQVLTGQTGQPVTEDQVRQVVDDLTGTAATGGPPPLVVPPEEAAGTGRRIPPPLGGDLTVPVTGPNAAFTGRSTPGGVETTGRYRAGDEYQPQTMSPTEIRRRQKELEKAGLLQPGYTPGFWDQASADALFEAMTYANRGGTDVQDVIAQLIALPRNVERPKFEAPPEIKPDPAFIAQSVKATFRSRLGREPTAEELAEFGGYWTSQYGAVYDEQVALARSQFDTEVAGMDAEEAWARRQEMLDAGATPSELRAAGLWDIQPPDTGAGSFTDVDPASRFAERFDARFRPEMEFIEGQQDTVRNANNVFASLTRMSSLVGR
jgi:hypothetical protein